jgi:protein tyrosine phosphatase (PTP) superfamily phosphohydrolase (DUF442 family)
MIRKLSLALALVALSLSSSASDAQKFVRQDSIRSLPKPVLLDTAGMFQDRYAKVGDDLFIGGQPTERALRELKAQGVTTIVNLRTPPEMARIGFDEPKLVAELGMKYVYLPVRGDGQFPYSPETLQEFTEVMRTAEGKVLLHCTVAWRASHLWLAYLVQGGVSPADALAHTRAINLMDDHRMDARGSQPAESFLGKSVTGLGKPPK